MSKRLRCWIRGALITCCISCTLHAGAGAQAIKVTKTVSKPNLICVLCSLTVVASPSSVTFSLVQGGAAYGSSAIAITTTLSGISAFNSVTLYGYFASASAALTDGYGSTPDTIPSSSVLGWVPTGAPSSTYVQFTNSGMLGTPGATLVLFSTSSMSATGCPLLSLCRTDSLNLEINLASQTSLPAGSYTGTLILQAEVL